MNYFEDQRNIINSKPFRRLADKTQVIVNLGQNAIIKTRLTHSIETASIAREIAANIGEIGKSGYKIDSDVVFNACLLHDIGMAPLGHIGETVMNAVVNKKFGLHFEANANNLAIINQRMPEINTFTILTTIKYPFLIKENEKGKGLYESQFAEFNDKLQLANLQQNRTTGFQRTRLIETDILEIADDISYLFGDFEDLIRVFKGNTDDLWNNIIESLETNNIYNFDIIESFKNCVFYKDFKKMNSIKSNCIKNVTFIGGSIGFKDTVFHNVLKSLREITWSEYILQFSIQNNPKLAEDWEHCLEYIFDNIYNTNVISQIIFSETLKKQYFSKIECPRFDDKLANDRDIAKTILFSISELSDTYALKCIEVYKENINKED